MNIRNGKILLKGIYSDVTQIMLLFRSDSGMQEDRARLSAGFGCMLEIYTDLKKDDR